MRVYTRRNPDDGAVITRTTVPWVLHIIKLCTILIVHFHFTLYNSCHLYFSSIWQPGKQTHFVVHGWLGSRNAFYLRRMKDAGLENVRNKVLKVYNTVMSVFSWLINFTFRMMWTWLWLVGVVAPDRSGIHRALQKLEWWELVGSSTALQCITKLNSKMRPVL